MDYNSDMTSTGFYSPYNMNQFNPMGPNGDAWTDDSGARTGTEMPSQACCGNRPDPEPFFFVGGVIFAVLLAALLAFIWVGTK